MPDPFIGEIRLFAGSYAPDGWALCDGSLLAISTYAALFSILGTTYGGNGTTNFGLPDLRGRLPMHPGRGNGLTPRTLGEMGGSETVTLLANQMPAHSHPVSASNVAGGSAAPEGGVPAYTIDANQNDVLSYSITPNTTMSPKMIGASGGSQPHDNMPPFQCVNFIIALNGIFPPRPS